MENKNIIPQVENHLNKLKNPLPRLKSIDTLPRSESPDTLPRGKSGDTLFFIDFRNSIYSW